ncbi:SDR family oxidoreductase [Thalassotalea crassostreae]|uniref:SDR family oxidoreductase n=1 Tax=Thalassotalea crassostreae TaxID=1763536 RepID=UPI0008380786|nr:SDR family oxidoreductase [Thalassotalea crassostreae]
MTVDNNGLGPDKVVLVTAGASGIGRTIAEKFLSYGCKVHICDVDKTVISEFLEANPSATASVADVSNVDEVKQMFNELVELYTRLDFLVNNAGIAGPTAPVEDIEINEWQQTINVDLNGQFYCTKYAVPLLKANGSGGIINISSNAAFFGFPLRSPYTASKWALVGLTKTWAMELGPHNIRVNALCPGSVSGDRIEGVINRDAQQRGVSPQEIKNIYAEQSSMRLFVSPEDVANMAIYLSSALGSSLSGQVIGIDGHTENLSCKF